MTPKPRRPRPTRSRSRLTRSSSWVLFDSYTSRTLCPRRRGMDAACGGDPVLLRKMIDSFQSCAPDHLRMLRHAVQAQDISTLPQAAHKLRGLVAAFCSTNAPHDNGQRQYPTQRSQGQANSTNTPRDSGLRPYPSQGVRRPTNSARSQGARSGTWQRQYPNR
jgi:hypothetical protein